MGIKSFEVNAYRRNLQPSSDSEFDWNLHEKAHRNCLQDFAKAIYNADKETTVLLVCGPSGGGKSHFIEANKDKPKHTILALDATLNNTWARAPYVAMAKAAGLKIHVVACYPSKQACIERQSSRPKEEQVDSILVERLYKAFQMPNDEEGFASISHIR